MLDSPHREGHRSALLSDVIHAPIVELGPPPGIDEDVFGTDAVAAAYVKR